MIAPPHSWRGGAAAGLFASVPGICRNAETASGAVFTDFFTDPLY